MNAISKAAIFNPQNLSFLPQTCLFHSTSFLQRKRRSFNFSDHRYNSKRFRRLHAKESVLRNINTYAGYVFQSWQDDFDEDDPSSSKGPSWFKKQYSRGSKRNWNNNRGNKHWGRRFEFCEEEIDVENILRNAFGGSRYFYWSFINEENPQWRSSFRYSNNYGKSWRFRPDEDYESSAECDNSQTVLASERVALGLSASGPLKLEDVKAAYRACALKWHPDRHQGSSKAVAEEKFKLCSAAYHSLCGKLADADQ